MGTQINKKKPEAIRAFLIYINALLSHFTSRQGKVGNIGIANDG
jgi:hypothetical protein